MKAMLCIDRTKANEFKMWPSVSTNLGNLSSKVRNSQISQTFSWVTILQKLMKFSHKSEAKLNFSRMSLQVENCIDFICVRRRFYPPKVAFPNKQTCQLSRIAIIKLFSNIKAKALLFLGISMENFECIAICDAWILMGIKAR